MSTKKETTAPTEKKPRIVSPEIAALRKEHANKVAALKAATVSSATLNRIIEDLLPKLTADDKVKLSIAIDASAIKPAN